MEEFKSEVEEPKPETESLEMKKSKKRRKRDDITDLMNFSAPNVSESD